MKIIAVALLSSCLILFCAAGCVSYGYKTDVAAAAAQEAAKKAKAKYRIVSLEIETDCAPHPTFTTSGIQNGKFDREVDVPSTLALINKRCKEACPSFFADEEEPAIPVALYLKADGKIEANASLLLVVFSGGILPCFLNEKIDCEIKLRPAGESKETAPSFAFYTSHPYFESIVLPLGLIYWGSTSGLTKQPKTFSSMDYIPLREDIRKDHFETLANAIVLEIMKREAEFAAFPPSSQYVPAASSLPSPAGSPSVPSGGITTPQQPVLNNSGKLAF